MAIVWRKTMSVGNKQIDTDHKYLICFINTVVLALQKPEEKEVLSTSLKQLYTYAYNHFMREETIQLEIGYPDIDKHREEHIELLGQLTEITNKINHEYSEKEVKENYEKLTSFLKEWLLHHVLYTDMLLKPYLEKYHISKTKT